ncbi:MAG: calcium/sodium antiporter [Clostridiales bacterium]|nr:calcium/sodium antiporter [Clostridiales bacterium]
MNFSSDIALHILLSVVGFIVLIKCADFFVDGASSFAKNFKIPTTVIGLTIVAFGTSAPELAIAFNAHLSNNMDMLFGNVFGSNIVNISVILGIAILIKPFKIQDDVIKKEMPILFLITIGVSVLFLDGLLDSAQTNTLTRADGMILLLFFCVFIYYLITVVLNKTGEKKNEMPKYNVFKSIVMILLGLAGIILGSHLVVDHVSSLAVHIGLSQKIISVTIISIGTSLPELVTIIVAAKKGENGIAIGSIVGSNIFNTCIVLGMPVVLLGAASTTAFNGIDIAFMLFSTALLWVFSTTNRELKRYEGAIFVAVYCAYVFYIFLQ